ncbi:MAG: M24 family metallopeptidase [Erysipelotrichaceae bacterium]|nr:M24 family metallopeptidase [Erysipelotrichaceae bacterium]
MKEGYMYSLKKQYEIADQCLKERLETVLPKVMEECGIECWLIACREYNEDPIMKFITPCHFPTARRLSIFVFYHRGDITRRISVSRPDPDLARFYEREYDVKNETQMEALTRVLRQLDPKNIAIDVSKQDYAYTDGLSHSLYEMFRKELPDDLTDRFVSADLLGIRYLETRTATELKYYPEVMKEAMEIIEAAFSDEVIRPGKTTCRDVMDFMEQMTNDKGLTLWFPATVDLQRQGGMLEEDTVIEKGDLLHCDFGIVYLNLCTDTQRLAYVARDNETDLPEELKQAMKRNNLFQDIVRSNMAKGLSGNETFKLSVEEGKKAGLRPLLYSHPCGLFGHSAGPTIGLWDNQSGEIPHGSLLIREDTSYALELSILEYLEMYRQDTYIFTEETVVYHDGEVSFLTENRDRIKLLGVRQ